MEINIPDVVAEVTAAFMKYQEALAANDLAMMNTLFWNSPHTVRYAMNGTLHGHKAIASFRQALPQKGMERSIRNTVITTFGRDFAATNTEVIRPGTTAIGRQSQSWVRMPEGWRIVAAHVSDQPNT